MTEPVARARFAPLPGELRSGVFAPHWFALLVTCVTLAGAVLRFIKLGESYWYDEVVTVGLVRSSLGSMIHALPGSESTPPLYYGIVWVWGRIFGTSEMALRSLSAIIGAAAIPLAAAAGKEFFSKPAGALAGALVAASPFLVWYSQEARAYSLYVVLSTLSLLLFARALKVPSRWRVAWWAVASAFAIWSQYFAGFLVAAETVVLLVDRRTRHHLALPFLGLAASTAILIPLVYRQARNGRNGWIADLSLSSRFEQATSWFLGFPSHLWWVATAVAVLLFATTVVADRGDRRVMLMLVALSGAAVVVPLTTLVVGKDFWLYRNVIDAWVPLAVALAGGVVSQGRAPSYARGLLAFVGISAVALLALKATDVVSDPHKRADWRGLASCLGSPDPGRVFLVTPSYNAVVLKLYRPNVQPPSRSFATASKIDLIGDPRSTNVPRGFERTGRICTDTIAVLQLRARTPVAVPKRVEGAAVVIDAPATN